MHSTAGLLLHPASVSTLALKLWEDDPHVLLTQLQVVWVLASGGLGGFFSSVVSCGIFGTSMLSTVVGCLVFTLLGSGQAQVAAQTDGQSQGQGQGQGQGQDSSATPWRQVIQWENNGRVFSLLNSGAEYVPARSGAQDRAPRVVVADSPPRSSGRPQGGNVRRQAPSRGSSETVRGQARHPFGFGQVPDNWRLTAGNTGGSQFQGSSASRFRPSTGSSSSSSSSSSFSSSSYNAPSYPQYQFPQQTPFQQVPYDPSFVEAPVRSYEPPFQPVGGGGYPVGGYGAGQAYPGGGYVGGAAPVLPGSPSDFTDDGYRYFQSYSYGAVPAVPQVPAVPAHAAQPPFADGLDRRYTHSLFNVDTAPAVPAPIPNQATPMLVDGTGPAVQPQIRSPQYEQFPPFGRPQPPFLQPIPAGRNSPNSAVENPNMNVGSVYRQEQIGTVRLDIGELTQCILYFLFYLGSLTKSWKPVTRERSDSWCWFWGMCYEALEIFEIARGKMEWVYL